MTDQNMPLASVVRNLINIDDQTNARYWANVFRVSDLDLVTAVMIVGRDAKAVAKFVGWVAKNPGRRCL